MVPTGLAQASRVDDPIYREIEGVIENIKARAGWSEGLPAKRNLYGEPITREGGVGPDIFSPIYMKTKPNDPGVKALVELDLYPGRLSKKLKGVELTDHEYERYQILRGKALKKQLHDLVQMPGFNDMPPGVRRDLIEPILDNTREAAQETLLLMFPELVIRMMEQYGGSLTEQYVQ